MNPCSIHDVSEIDIKHICCQINQPINLPINQSINQSARIQRGLNCTTMRPQPELHDSEHYIVM